MFELDHVFLCPGSEPGGERVLEAFGIRLGGRGVHRGQGAAIPVVTRKDAWWGPMVFLSLVAQVPATLPAARRPPLEHAGKRRILTSVTLRQPLKEPLSPGIRWLVEKGFFAVHHAEEYGLELEWDEGKEGQTHDFRPALPMTIRW